MFEISVRDEFDAAHYLRGYHGKCENLHGHRYAVVVTVRSADVDETGMAYDFSKLRRQLAEVLGVLDHTCLNDRPPFDKINPSAENIARTIYYELAGTMGDARSMLKSVQVWESPHSAATYSPGEGE